MKQLSAFFYALPSVESRIARVLFREHEGKMVLLHAFIKKTQKTQAISNWPSGGKGKSDEKDKQARANWIVFR